MKVYFCNEGYFDVRAMLTFGVSAKGSDEAIGYFGTGFKYAVAIILRHGGKVSVSTSDEKYEFESRKETIRDDEFNIVYMNGREAGFTTHLGINWEPWMAFRELYSNCTDENGIISDSPARMETIVEVECEEIHKAFINKHEYFIEGEPLCSSPLVDIYEPKSPYIYYRGVAVQNMGGTSTFCYNIKKQVTLTEDRTVKWNHEVVWSIQKALQSMTDDKLLRRLFHSKQEFELKLGFDTDWPVSEEFIVMAREFMASGKGVSEPVRMLLSKIDEKAGNWPELELTPVQEKMLESASLFLSGIGIDLDMFPIRAVSGLGDGVMGRALDGIIYISEIPFHMGTKQVASTLLEEWVHNKYGCEDFDRNMQSWLFDKILSIGEEINGEPL